jgi:predicted RNA-binding Zn-ribbon protein involved in translation (DUF1610 family)
VSESRRFKCPNCDEKIEVGFISSNKEFRCPKCAALLRFPKKSVERLRFSFLFVLIGFIILAIVATLHHDKDLLKLLALESDPIIGLGFWVGLAILFISFILMAVASYRLKLRVVRLPRSCGSCGSTILVKNAHFCIRCGADLGVVSSKRISGLRKVETSAISIESSGEKRLGICTVCREDVKGNDIRAWCPNCGGLAHRIHLLEYLHVHNECPACGNHLDEKDILQSLSEGRPSKMSTEASQTTARRKGRPEEDSTK